MDGAPQDKSSSSFIWEERTYDMSAQMPICLFNRNPSSITGHRFIESLDQSARENVYLEKVLVQEVAMEV